MPKKKETVWTWNAEEPSKFEENVSEFLEKHNSSNGMYVVKVFSWDNKSISAQEFINKHSPKSASFPHDRIIIFWHIEDELKVKIPEPTHYHVNDPNCIGQINISTKEFFFKNQTLIIIACNQQDYDKEINSLKGLSDAVGYLSLMVGGNILYREIFAKYFCTKRRKFVSGELELRPEEPYPSKVFGLRDFYEIENFDAEDDITHATLWFAGKAFTSKDYASKLVNYHTALEIIGGKNFQNTFGKIYSRNPEVLDAAKKALSEISKLRGYLVHKGKQVELDQALQRKIQIFILDAIIYKQKGKQQKTAFAEMWNEK